MFSGRVHMRLVGLLVQSLSYLFIFWSLNEYGGDCGEVVVVTVLPLAEVMGRTYYYCWMGQSVICAGEGLLAAVREAAYEVGLGTPTHDVLSELANRLEATPPSIKIWGMGSVSARTHVKLSGVLMTYVVVLLQFCERSAYASNTKQYEAATPYDHCFGPSNNNSV
ncbi:uncharacterized protein LOC127002438 [Eriocheir sinensis]|uniref:uncharacterized protein LOC127002438 n=1 Tax=Eriocheir sinensis TaxID=95602 RepID=UPI0021C6FD59|nr:uncharacterized protein LOC127002438 [Eriocheir sinensis]